MLTVGIAIICFSSCAFWIFAATCIALFGATVLPVTSQDIRRELVAIRKIASMVNRVVDLRTIVEAALDEILAVHSWEAGVMRLSAVPDVAREIFVARGFRHGSHSFPPAAGPAWLRYGILVNLPEAPSDPGARAWREAGFSYLGSLPLRSADRELGMLCVASRGTPAVDTFREDFIGGVADMLATAATNAHLHDQATKLAEDFVALQEVNKITSRSFDLEEIIGRIVVEGKRLVKTSACHLFLVDDRRQLLVGSASTQADAQSIRRVELELSETSAVTKALAEKRVITVEDIAAAAGAERRLAIDLDWRAAIFVPLLTKEQSIGVLICSDNAPERAYTPEQILRAETLGHQATIALENARLFQVVSRSQKEWETTFDAMQDCVSVHEMSGKVIRANLALARRLKTTPQKIIGRKCCEIYESKPDAPLPCRHTEAFSAESLVVEELELPLMGGAFQLSVSPWYDKNNRLAGSIHVAKDVSNEKLLQQQLIQSEKLSAIGELISGIAHELNNPLTGVMGYSQLLQLRNDLDQRARDNLLKINNLALRCQKIVQNLLSFARKQKPERTLVNVNEILERTVELRSYEFQVNNVEIVRDLDHDLPRTIADGHQLQQIFLNLLTNAEQAMLEANGKGRLIIRTRQLPNNGCIVVEIHDDGPGIPESHLTRIFDPFFTTKEVGKGTGLGLSLSYGMIKEHGGNIYARNRGGGGATFVIELPLITQLQDPAVQPPQQAPRDQALEKLVQGKHALVVDDEKYILDFFTEVFQIFPMRVDTARNGRLALEKILVNDYDLIITDYKMPQMGGKDLFHWILQNRPHLAKKIIFVTGDTVSPDTRAFFETTRNRYLAKPFKIEDVKEVVQETLEIV
jgi:two-component system, NtrC family, sensor kinase